jgi:hypothetical protein
MESYGQHNCCSLGRRTLDALGAAGADPALAGTAEGGSVHALLYAAAAAAAAAVAEWVVRGQEDSRPLDLDSARHFSNSLPASSNTVSTRQENEETHGAAKQAGWAKDLVNEVVFLA